MAVRKFQDTQNVKQRLENQMPSGERQVVSMGKASLLRSCAQTHNNRKWWGPRGSVSPAQVSSERERVGARGCGEGSLLSHKTGSTEWPDLT